MSKNSLSKLVLPWLAAMLLVSGLTAQQTRKVEFQVGNVLRNLGSQDTSTSINPPWWTRHTADPINRKAKPVKATLNDLIFLTIQHSAKISVARHVPLIRETAVTESSANFDWTRYLSSQWNDTSEPVGSSLTVGGTGTRFREEALTLTGGLRRTLRSGAQIDVSQEFGHTDSNSTFFIPNNQATARLVLGFTQPLLRGRGEVYNTSLIMLARIDVGSSEDEFSRQLQAHLLEVVRGYWGLYLERANLTQKVKLYLTTEKIVDQLKKRQAIDAQRTQVISAQAALESRKSELIRARAAVKNAETRLRALINAPEFQSNPEQIEIVPAEHPTIEAYPVDLAGEFETSIANRPEIAAAMKSIKAACIRLKMAQHEVLPMLNLVTKTYVAGLRGDSRFKDAFTDQFSVGEPSYSVGLQYEIPIGRRASRARQSRRELEFRQMNEEYRSTLELVRAEVEVAVREVNTSFKELKAKYRAQKAAETEAEAIEIRWKKLADRGSTGGLLLESLLRAQERVTQAEFEFAKAQLTYNLSLINLRHANGTILQIVDYDGKSSVVSNSGRQPTTETRKTEDFKIQDTPPLPKNRKLNPTPQSPQVPESSSLQKPVKRIHSAGKSSRRVYR